MDAETYLRSLLTKYRVDASDGSPLVRLANEQILPVLQQWRGQDLLDIRLSGSIAKGTANAGANDMDLFVPLRSAAQGNLGEIYRSLFNVCGQFWTTRAQNVSVGIQCGGYHVDLVPGKLQNGYTNWFSLWRNKANTWTQTNIDLQVQTVANSGRVDEIRILKLWRTLAKLEFPSFALELATIEALKGRRQGQLADNVWFALGWLQTHIETVRLVDPANTNNVVSDDMTLVEKRAAAQAAARARTAKYYSELVW